MKFKNKLSACILIFVFVLIIANCSFADDSNQTVAVNTTTESSDVISATVNSEIYISSTGSDDNDGSINSPKATFSGQNGALKTASSNNINTIIILDGTIQESNIYINSSIYSLNSLTIKGSAQVLLMQIMREIYLIFKEIPIKTDLQLPWKTLTLSIHIVFMLL